MLKTLDPTLQYSDPEATKALTGPSKEISRA